MRKSKKLPDADMGLRPQVTRCGIARLLGISTSTVYDRIKRGRMSLDGIPCQVLRTQTLYDLEAVVERFIPGTKETRHEVIIDFMQAYGGVVR